MWAVVSAAGSTHAHARARATWAAQQNLGRERAYTNVLPARNASNGADAAGEVEVGLLWTAVRGRTYVSGARATTQLQLFSCRRPYATQFQPGRGSWCAVFELFRSLFSVQDVWYVAAGTQTRASKLGVSTRVGGGTILLSLVLLHAGLSSSVATPPLVTPLRCGHACGASGWRLRTWCTGAGVPALCGHGCVCRVPCARQSTRRVKDARSACAE